MRIDLGMILAIALEYIIFIYYADTLFYRKRSKYICYAIIGLGYILHLAVCMFGKVIVNTASIVIIHFICFKLCYHISNKSAVFQSVLLDAMNAVCEYIIIFISYLGVLPNDILSMTPTQSFILTLASKVLYLIGIMVISRLFCNKRKKAQHTSIGLITIPVCNVIIILLMINVNVTSNLLSLACFILIVMNIVVFVINQKMITAETELEEQRLKQKFDYEEYTLLKETQQRAYILNHDLKEHMNALSSLIGSDNEKAQGYIKSIYGKINQSQFVEYSDSKILNILLSKKKEECRSKGIKFFIDPIQAKLTFFEDMDIVTVFSNLINNAIENCIMSEEKKMYLNIHTENENFVVIKTENTADVKTVVINGRLKTHKDNKKLHGIGMNSIKKTLSDYNGLLTWKYNEAERIFSKTIIIKLNRLGKYTTA